MNSNPVFGALTGGAGAAPPTGQAIGGAVNTAMQNRTRMNPRMGQPGPGIGQMDLTQMLGNGKGGGKRPPGGIGGGGKLPAPPRGLPPGMPEIPRDWPDSGGGGYPTGPIVKSGTPIPPALDPNAGHVTLFGRGQR